MTGEVALTVLVGCAWVYLLTETVRNRRRNAERDAALELEKQEQRRLEAIAASKIRALDQLLSLLQETDDPQEARRLSAELSQAVTDSQAAREQS